MRYSHIAPLLLLSIGGTAAAEDLVTPVQEHVPENRRAARVVIISEDGLRPDLVASMKLPWHEAIYRHGAYSWKARTIRTASTLPSHASMLSGVDVDAHGLTWNNWRPSKGYIKVPSIFHTAEQAGLKSAMFVGKSKLRHIATPGSVEVFSRSGYYCKKVASQAAAYLVANPKTELVFIHFSDPDEAGHSKGWGGEAYKLAVLHSDHCLGIVVDALAKAKMFEDTLLIISADHGGHNHTHSGANWIDRVIPWIAHGPGVRDGYKLQGDISTMDTATTALYALGLKLSPSLRGKVVTEMYRD